ncbi:MAG: hypothetical protein HWN81_23000 [Candidatus Lokiarchaeota archaeon]|nr:hypothetical protein [Candidatus Lokiarchaeota archaeon]
MRATTIVTIIKIITSSHFGFITPAINSTAQSGTNKAITNTVVVPANSPIIFESGKSEIGLKNVVKPITIRKMLVK